MEAKERKMGLKKLQLRSSSQHLRCFRYTFHYGCCCGENEAYDGFVRNNRLFKTPCILYDTYLFHLQSLYLPANYARAGHSESEHSR